MLKKKLKLVIMLVLIIVVLIIGYKIFTSPLPGQPAQTNKENINATATVYVRDPATGDFNVWNGLAFGQNNPMTLTDGFSVILPAGEYYVRVEAEGYDSANSLVSQVKEQSIVTANINLGRKRTRWDKLVATFSQKDVSNNFPLAVTPLPESNLLRVGEYLPEITAYNKDGQEYVFFKEMYDKPVIIYVFSTWNTEAQEQMDIFENVYRSLQDKYKFVVLSTMEPGAINQTKLTRGNYEMEFYKPSDKFYDDYKIISLPQFFLATKRGELVGVITGSKSAEELVNMINEMYK